MDLVSLYNKEWCDMQTLYKYIETLKNLCDSINCIDNFIDEHCSREFNEKVFEYFILNKPNKYFVV